MHYNFTFSKDWKRENNAKKYWVAYIKHTGLGLSYFFYYLYDFKNYKIFCFTKILKSWNIPKWNSASLIDFYADYFTLHIKTIKTTNEHKSNILYEEWVSKINTKS